MSARLAAGRAGVRRGLTEYLISLRTPGETVFTLVGVAIGGVMLYLNRGVEIAPGVPVTGFVLASILTIQLLFVTTYQLATLITTEREFGTLLRARSVPRGLTVYAVGSMVRIAAEMLLTVILTLAVAAAVLGADLGVDAVELLRVVIISLLGLVALTAAGFAIGALFRSPRAVGGWGLVVVGALVWVSGLIQPLASMPGWVQVLGQSTPLYWIGLVLRSAFLPEGLETVEIDGSWRLPLAFAVVTAWAVVAVVIAPILLRRAARRENAALMESRRTAALNRV